MPTARDGAPVAALPSGDAAIEEESDDFLRGDNSLSVAAEKRLEVDAKVGFYYFLPRRTRVVPKDQVVLRGMIVGRR